MSRMINLTLPAEITSEILNYLRDGVEVLTNTEEYLASGSVVAPCEVAGCSSIRKVRRMLKLYEGAITVIENKMRKKL
jgi:hypothetical protein